MGIQAKEEELRRTIEYYSKRNELTEEWKTIDAFEIQPIYKISNHGRIMNNDGKILKPYKQKGYLRIHLKIKNNTVGRSFSIHRLVAAMFIKVPEKHIERGLNMDILHINHINGIKHHNAVFNLEWCTPKENSIHAHQTGLAWKLHGENNPHARFSDETMEHVCECLSEGASNKEIKDKFDVSDSAIYALAQKEIRDDLTSKFVFEHRRKELTTDDIHNICKDIVAKEMSIYKIADKWDLSADYVYALINNEYHPEITSQYPLADSIKRRLTDDEVRDIWRDIMAKELSISKLAKKYGMSEPYIKKLKAGKLRHDIRAEFIKD